MIKPKRASGQSIVLRTGKQIDALEALKDESLTADEFGVLIFLRAQSNDWSGLCAAVADRFHMAHTKTHRIFRGLTAKGWLKLRYVRDKGAFVYLEYTVAERPKIPKKPVKNLLRFAFDSEGAP